MDTPIYERDGHTLHLWQTRGTRAAKTRGEFLAEMLDFIVPIEERLRILTPSQDSKL